jgi:hypothetical protein
MWNHNNPSLVGGDILADVIYILAWDTYTHESLINKSNK